MAPINETIIKGIEALTHESVPWYITILATIGAIAIIYGAKEFGSKAISLTWRIFLALFEICIVICLIVKRWSKDKK